jgi:HAE1 family hydrophobic/amphiphilic exporter-1
VWLSDFSIRRPVFAVMLIGALVALGLISLGRIGVDMFPPVEFPMVSVATILEGATPDTVETEVTDVLEERLNTISGVKSINSRSSENLSQIFVRFELDEDIDVKAQDVRDKVALARLTLPTDAEPPIVEKMDPDAEPILGIMLAGDLPRGELTRLAKDVVKERIERIPGVGSVTLVGGREREVRIWLDLFRLRAYGLTAADVLRAIQTEHADLPGGRLETAGRTAELSLKTQAEVQSVPEFGEIVVAYRSGAPVRIREVGRVQDGLEDERTYAELDGMPGVSLLVRRQSGRNLVEVARGVKDEVERTRALRPAGVRVVVSRDLSRFIESSIRDVGYDMILGGILAVLVTLAFLRSFRTTLIVGIAIPTSIISTFFMFYVMGFTLNVLTLIALSVSIGILIDDAIVVLENIYRRIEGGEAPMEAARRGTAQISGAVLASTISIMAVFIPIAFLGGVVGRFFYQYGLAVVFAVGVSLLVALTLTPTLCARTLRLERRHGRVFLALETIYTRLEGLYRQILETCLRHRLAVVGAAVASVFLGIAIARTVPLEFSSHADRAEFEGFIEMPLGTGIERTKEVGRRVVQALGGLRHVYSVFLTVGSGSRGRVNEADLYIQLTPKQDREKGERVIMNEARAIIRKAAPQAKAITVRRVPEIAGSGSFGSDIMYSVRGPKLETLAELTEAIATELRSDPFFTDVQTSFELGRPEIRTVIDRRRAAELGIPVRSVASTLRALVGGVDVATYQQDAKRYDVHVRLEEGQRDDLAELGLIQFRGPDGRLADLDNLAKNEVIVGPSQIERENRTRQVTVLASTLPGVSLGPAMERVDEIVAEVGLPPGYEGEHRGRVEMMQESLAAIWFAFGLALLALYMILASQFNSFVQPAIVMLAAPLSFVGAFAALALTGAELAIFVQIGLVMLMGLVMKNGILLVDYANQLREKGSDSRAAMLGAGPVRLRPVLMTTFSTVFGMVPIAVSTSDGSEFRNALGILIIGGLLSSMFLTLLVVPVVYTLVDDLRSRLAAVEWGRGSARREAT